MDTDELKKAIELAALGLFVVLVLLPLSLAKRLLGAMRH